MEEEKGQGRCDQGCCSDECQEENCDCNCDTETESVQGFIPGDRGYAPSAIRMTALVLFVIVATVAIMVKQESVAITAIITAFFSGLHDVVTSSNE